MSVRRALATIVLLVVVFGATLGAVHALQRTPSAALPAENATAVRTWVWHFDDEHAETVVPIYRGLLASLAPTADVLVIVRDAADEQACRAALGDHGRDPRVRFAYAGATISPWARDLYIFFTKQGSAHMHTLPTSMLGPCQQGVSEVARILKERDVNTRVVKSGGGFQGGDVLVTRRHVLIGRATIEQNLPVFGGSEARLRRRVEGIFGRKLLVIGRDLATLTYDHIDMFLSVLDDDTLLLADPRLAADLFQVDGAPRDELAFPVLGRFLRQRQSVFARAYDALATDLQEAGYKLVRVPILHGEPGGYGMRGAVINWNNAVIDRDAAGRAVVFVPRYGIPSLDERAHETWQRLGFTVHAIDARVAISRGGAIRCVTNCVR